MAFAPWNSLAAAANQWKVVVDPLVNKTEGGREESLKKVIQQSIITFVGQVDSMKVEAGSDEKTTAEQAIMRTYQDGKDVLITGSYAVIGDTIYIYVSVYDVLVKQLKLEKSYSGKAGEDIFDTLDVIIANLKKDITTAVKPMDEETFVKYRKRVELVSDDIKIPRAFTTSFGWSSSFTSALGYTGAPFIALDFQLDWLNFGANVFTPLLVPQANSIADWANSLINAYAGYHFGNMTAGVGVFVTFMSVTLDNTYQYGFGMSFAMFSPLVFFRYDFGKTLYLKAVAGLGNFNYGYNEPYWSPIFGLTADYYFSSDFGIKAEVYLNAYSGTYIDSYSLQNISFKADNLFLLMGINYRIDLK